MNEETAIRAAWTWHEQVAEVERWLRDSTVEMPEVLR